MYNLKDWCCLCLNESSSILNRMQSKSEDNLSYFYKISASMIPVSSALETDVDYMVCNECCDIIDVIYKFNGNCLKNLNIINYSNKSLKTDSDNQIVQPDIPVNDDSSALKLDNSNIPKDIIIKKEIDDSSFDDESDITPFFQNTDENCSTKMGFDEVKIKSECFRNVDEYLSENEDENVEAKVDCVQSKFDVENKSNIEKVKKGPGIQIVEEKSQIRNEYNDQDSGTVRNKNDANQCGTKIIKLTEHKPEPKNKKPHSCEVCNKTFASKYALNIHMYNHRGEKPYSCDVCNKSFAKKAVFIDHKRIHTGEKPFPCEFCDKSFSTKIALVYHERIHTGENLYFCDVCSKSFTRKHNLTEHMRLHTGEKFHYCEICNKAFSRKSNLALHKRTHTGERLYSCNTCEKSFKTKSAINRHMLSHTGEKPFSCEFCEKKFIQRSSLIIHTSVHTGEKPYSCDICSKPFTQKWTLAVHKSMHSGEKPFCCEVCDKSFLDKTTLARHRMTHTGEKPYTCDVCNKAYSQNSSLVAHKRTHATVVATNH